MILTQTPPGLFDLLTSYTALTWPRPRRTSPRRSDTARLLQFLLQNDIEDWSAIDFPTLEALYEETIAYPSMEDAWDDEDDPDRMPIDHAFNNAWHVVCAGETLVRYQRLPVVPVLTHPFY